MPVLSTLATLASVIGTVAGVAGTLVSYSAQKKAEKLREQQMRLELQRQRMQVVRESNRQRALINATAAQQGSSLGSGAAGAAASVTSQQGTNILGINQSEKIGAGIFKANSQNAFGGLISSFGSGLTSLAGSLADSDERRRRLSSYYGNTA